MNVHVLHVFSGLNRKLDNKDRSLDGDCPASIARFFESQ